MRHHPAMSALTIVGLLAGTLVVLAAAAWTLTNMSYSRALERELASLRADGYALTLDEVRPKPVADASNAASIYMPLFQVSFDPQHPTYTEQDGSKRGLNRFKVERNERLSGVGAALAAREIIASPDAQAALAQLKRASEMPFCVFPVRWEDGFSTLFPHMAQLRQATRMVCAQALILDHDGKKGEALQWLGVAYRMGDQAAGEPTLIAQLVGIAIRAIADKAAHEIIADADLTPKQARDLHDQLGRVSVTETYDRALRMELVVGLGVFEQLTRHPEELSMLLGDGVPLPPTAARLLFSGAGRPLLKLEKANYAQTMHELLRSAPRPYREVANQPELQVQPGIGHLVAGMLVPTLTRTGRKRDQSLASTRLLQIVLALKAQKQSLGRYPESLTGLIWLPPTEDPFTGQPLVYKRQGNGFVLYSVGPNLKDNGGKEPAERKNINEEGDIVWRCGR